MVRAKTRAGNYGDARVLQQIGREIVGAGDNALSPERFPIRAEMFGKA